MNINVNDEILSSDTAYQEFLRTNTSTATLKIRASAASQALPVSGVNIVVSKEIGNNNIIFFEGVTDDSGMINNIVLPAPQLNPNDEVAPTLINYTVKATYPQDNLNKEYKVTLYGGTSAIQYIFLSPNVSLEERDLYGS